MSDTTIRKPHKSFGAMDFLWRLVAALALVFVTFNPSGLSYIHWAKAAFSGEGLQAVHFFAGIILLIGWSIFIIATSRSLGTFGTILSVALMASGIWLLADIGIIQVDSATTVTWLVLIVLAFLLAVGLSWSHVWRRLSGQLEVDEVDD